MTVQPNQPRYRIDSDGSSLHLIIPSRKNWLLILITSIWAIIWIGMTLGFMSGVIRPWIDQPFSLSLLIFSLFGLAWLAIWLLIGGYGVYTLLWQLIGSEIIDVSPVSISIRRKVVGLEKPKTYDSGRVKDLRIFPYMPRASWPGSDRNQFWMGNASMLAFDYGAKTIHFGDLKKAEAKMALAEILRQYPAYHQP